MIWVEEKSEGSGLRGLSIPHQKKLLLAIQRARQEQLDFQPVELDVFELATHYVFYYLEKRGGRLPKHDYINKVKQLIKLGQTIRVGKPCLSNLVSKSELVVSDKAEFAKLIERLEVANEIR